MAEESALPSSLWSSVSTRGCFPCRDMAIQPLYPNRYVWFVLLSAMDVMLTFVILWMGGREANGIANAILQRFGIAGMTAFKFLIVIFVILLCELIGRRNDGAARRLAEWSIALTCVPVVVAFVLLLANVYSVDGR